MSELIEAARAVRMMAYAPYSGYEVGAAVRGDDDRIYAGCNVENASYPQGVCAEKNAIAAMIAGGSKQCLALAIVTEDGALPCGGCLQTLNEFAKKSGDLPIYVVAVGGENRAYTLRQLLPHAFRSKSPE